ncbi:WD40-repeat-containing domain protein [Lanmaoa asiatica]|nr:WD40-repeat-containing domain protein [Lanmaoa asiatica]
MHEHIVWCVLWSRSDGSRLFSASEDKTIRCWNSVTGEPIGHPWTGHTGLIYSLALSPDGSILASASWDATARFWDVNSGDPIGQPLQHDGSVYAVCFSPSGDFVTSAGASGYLWRVPWLDSVEDQVIAPFVCVLALLRLPPRCCRHVGLSLMYATLNLACTSLSSPGLAPS